MTSEKSALLLSRRFGPLFLVQFLGAFNGNLCKTAMLFLVTFTLLGLEDIDPATFGALAAGLFVIPFFLFSALAGRLADRFDKTKMTQVLKLYEAVVMALGTAAMASKSVPFMLVVLFLIGCQSAFFGPIKYAILPQHVAEAELLSATGYVEAGTFIAILLRQIVGGVISPVAVGGLMISISVIGILASRLMPAAPAVDRSSLKKRQSYFPFADSLRILSAAAANQRLWRAIIGISWFWGIGALMTAQLVVLVETELLAVPLVATVFLVIFSIGISVGSMLANSILKSEVSARLAPLAAFLMSISLVVFLFAISHGHANVGAAQSLSAADFFLSSGGVVAVMGLSGMALSGGLFVVPLYTILQTAGPAETRARDVAANNIVNAAAMVALAALAALLLALGLTIPFVLLILAGVNLIVAGIALAMKRGMVVRWGSNG